MKTAKVIDVGVDRVDAILSMALWAYKEQGSPENIENLLELEEFSEHKSVEAFVEHFMEKIPDAMEIGERFFIAHCDHDWGSYKHWCAQNWGTKIGAFFAERIDDNTITFQTAWDGAPCVILVLSILYPQLLFNYQFAPEFDDDNSEEFIFQDGEWLR